MSARSCTRLAALASAMFMWVLASGLATWTGVARANSAGPLAWITNGASGTVSVVNTAGNTVEATIAVGSTPFGVAVHPSRTRVYVTNQDSNTVSVIDADSRTVIATIAVGAGPTGIAVSPSGDRVYVVNHLDHSVSVISAASNSVLATVAGVGTLPVDISVDPGGSRIFVAGGTANRLYRINALTYELSSVLLGTPAYGVALNATGTRAYVSSPDGGNVHVIDTQSLSALTAIAVGSFPLGVASNPVTGQIYVANHQSNSVSVIDPLSHAVLGTVGGFNQPLGLAVTADGSRLYVANAGANTVSAVDAASHTVTGTVAVGSTPYALGQFIAPCTACVFLPPGTLAWWDAQASAADRIGSAGGTLAGAATYAWGKVGQAFNLGGISDYVDAGTSNVFNFGGGVTDFTIEAWIRPAVMPPYASGIVSKGSGAPFTGWAFYFYGDGRLGFGGVGVWEFTSAGGVVQAGEWAHVAVTRTGSTYRLYKNGVEVAAANRNGNLQTSTSALKIGRVYMAPEEDPGACGASLCSFTGLIDEVRIVNRGLSAAELRVVVNAGAAGVCTLTSAPASLVPNGDFEADAAGTPGSAITGWTLDTFNMSDGGVRGTSPQGTHQLQVSNARAFSGTRSISSYVRNNAGGGGGDANGRHATSDLKTTLPFATQAGTLYLWRSEVSYSTSARWYWRLDVLLNDGATDVWFELACRAWGNSEGCSGNFQDTHDATSIGADGQIWYRHSIAIPAGMNRSNLKATIRHQQDAWDGTTAESTIYYDLLTDYGVDAVPAPFTLAARNNLALNATVMSDTVMVTDINAVVPVSITGGEYSINGGAFTSLAGEALAGDQVRVRLPAPSAYGATANATLTIGTQSSTYSVSTGAFPGASIPQTSLRLWLKADVGVEAASGAVSAWRDQSGNGFDLVQGATAKRPQLLGEVLNGRPVLRFDGDDDYLETAAPVNLALAGNGATTFVVLKPGATQKTWADILDYQHSFNVNYVIQQFDGNTNRFPHHDDLGKAQTLAPGVYQVLSLRFPIGSPQSSWLNGANELLAGAPSPAWSEPAHLTIGNKSLEAFARQFNGDIAEIILYNQPLDSAARQSVEAYLMAKYGLDALPDTITLGSQTVSPGAIAASGTATIAGISTVLGVSIAGGEYSINGGAWTSAPGIVLAGDTVSVRLSAPVTPGSQATATLNLGSTSVGFTAAAAGLVVTPQLESGWNLLGNALNSTISVAAVFGNVSAPTAVTPNVLSVWKWNAQNSVWQFYSPQQSAPQMDAYAQSKGYELLASIGPGEGYWVNVQDPSSLPAQTGAAHHFNAALFSVLPAGWNLIAHAGSQSPSDFNQTVSPSTPVSGVVPVDTFFSLWAWNAALQQWYFYSPLQEASGGQAAVKAYAGSKGYLHFADDARTLGQGVGFWVNKIEAPATN